MTKPRNSAAAPPEARGDDTVTGFYNGACPVCRPEIAHYQTLARRRPAALAWRDLADDPEALAGYGITPEDAKRRLHALDEAGRLVSGVDAFLAIWRNLPVYRHLAGVVALPAVRPFADLVYERGLVPALERLNARRARRRGWAAPGADDAQAGAAAPEAGERP